MSFASYSLPGPHFVGFVKKAVGGALSGNGSPLALPGCSSKQMCTEELAPDPVFGEEPFRVVPGIRGNTPKRDPQTRERHELRNVRRLRNQTIIAIGTRTDENRLRYVQHMERQLREATIRGNHVVNRHQSVSRLERSPRFTEKTSATPTCELVGQPGCFDFQSE